MRWKVTIVLVVDKNVNKFSFQATRKESVVITTDFQALIASLDPKKVHTINVEYFSWGRVPRPGWIVEPGAA